MGLAEAGSFMRNGFNTKGVGLCASSLKSIYDSYEIGLSTTFLRRKILGSSSIEESKQLILSWQRSVSNNFLLVSYEGRALNLEVTPRAIYELGPSEGIVSHANHFI